MGSNGGSAYQAPPARLLCWRQPAFPWRFHRHGTAGRDWVLGPVAGPLCVGGGSMCTGGVPMVPPYISMHKVAGTEWCLPRCAWKCTTCHLCMANGAAASSTVRNDQGPGCAHHSGGHILIYSAGPAPYRRAVPPPQRCQAD